MRRFLLVSILELGLAVMVAAQSAVTAPKQEQMQKQEASVNRQQEKRAQQASTIEFQGERVFKEKDLRSAVKEQISTIEQYGLSPARADDLAFFVEVFYRKHGYSKVSVHYAIES